MSTRRNAPPIPDHDHGTESNRHSHDPELTTAADLMAGAILPMRLRLTVNIRPESFDGNESQASPNGVSPPKGLSLESRLRPHGAQLRAWAQRDPENIRQLLLDPLAAVGRAGLKLSPQDLSALKRRINRDMPREVLPAGVELTALNVRVGYQESAGNERGDQESYRGDNKPKRSGGQKRTARNGRSRNRE